jgi:hypothetical protein
MKKKFAYKGLGYVINFKLSIFNYSAPDDSKIPKFKDSELIIKIIYHGMINKILNIAGIIIEYIKKYMNKKFIKNYHLERLILIIKKLI